MKKQSSTPSSRISKVGASSIECHALHTVVPTSESSRPLSSTETNISTLTKDQKALHTAKVSEIRNMDNFCLMEVVYRPESQ